MFRTVAVLAALGVAVAGCAGNNGESTTCRDFTGMSQDARGAAVARMLKERNGLNGSTSDVQAQVARATAFCATNGNQDKTINDAR
jgi:acid stress chaperone HdeA